VIQWAKKPLRSIFKTVIVGESNEDSGEMQDLEDGAITDIMARKTQILDFFIVILIFIGNGLFYFAVGSHIIYSSTTNLKTKSRIEWLLY
jgi:hypothetical protein